MTGKEIAYLVPGCELRSMGANTAQLPIAIVSKACHQFIPFVVDKFSIVYLDEERD